MATSMIRFSASILALAAGLCPIAAIAQNTARQPSVAPTALAADGQNAAADPEATTTDSADIIVTATLRRENLQEVPLAVTAFSGATLDRAGVSDLRNFKTVASSFNLINSQNESGSSVISVRGVGTIGNNAGFDLSVGLFLDGVYLSRASVALGDLMDVEQVELLRGPQGTLFGRNTTAGAISITTAKPRLDRTEAFMNATYGNLNLMNVQAGISAPLVQDKVGLRISAAWRDRDGYLRNASGGESNDRNRYIVRGQLYAEPSPGFDLRIIGDYARTKERCCDAIITRDTTYATNIITTVGGVGVTPYGANGLPNNGGVISSGDSALNGYVTGNSAEFRDDSEQWGLSGTINLDLGFGKLTSITAYRDFKSETQEETDLTSSNVFSTSDRGSTATASSGHNYTTIKTFTQEVRLAGTTLSGRLSYLFGGYYSDERIEQLASATLGRDHQAYVSAILTSVGAPGNNPARNIFANGISTEGATASNLFNQSSRNWSLFTNNTFDITDRFKFNFGLRYSNDSKRGTFNQLYASNPACAAARANAALFPTLPTTDPRRALAALAPAAASLTCFFAVSPANSGAGSPQTFDRSFDNDDLIYTAKLLWSPVRAVNTYASFSHGYKSGGFNLDASAAINGGNPAFLPETVDAYEVGIKTRFMNGAVTANLAVFRQDIRNYQLLEFTGSQFSAYNVPKARSQGVELETTLRPSRYVTFNQSITYLDAKFTKDCDGGTYNGSVSTLCGYSFYNTPDWTIVTGVNWWQPLSNDLKVTLSGNVRFESDRRAAPQAIFEVAAGTGTISLPNYPGGVQNTFVEFPKSVQDGNAKVNLRLAVGSIDDRWSFELWGDNLTDEHTLGSTFRPPFRGVATLPGPFNAGGVGVAVASYVQEPRTYGITGRFRF